MTSPTWAMAWLIAADELELKREASMNDPGFAPGAWLGDRKWPNLRSMSVLHLGMVNNLSMFACILSTDDLPGMPRASDERRTTIVYHGSRVPAPTGAHLHSDSTRAVTEKRSGVPPE